MTTENTTLVRTMHENLSPEPCLKVEVEQNSQGTNMTASYRGDDEDEVIATVMRVREQVNGAGE